MLSPSRFAAPIVMSLALYAASAHATVMDSFTFTSAQIPSTVTASVAASPTPSSFVPNVSFNLANLQATIGGSSFVGDVTFFVAGGAGGGGALFGGETLFTGPVNAPTFRLGTFSLSGNADLGDGTVPVTGQLTISSSNVPEPWTLATTGTGILGLVNLLRRRQSTIRS